ncbi:hypothetical protein Tco_1084911 [Tanacetum coccineum]
MAAPSISILSEESMGSHAPRVILFGAIPAIIPVIPEVPIVPADPIVAPEEGTVSVVSPTGVLDLVDYSSSSDSDPSEDSLPPVPDLPLVSPSGSSSHDTLAPSSEYPLAPVVAPPGIRRRRAILIRPGEDIPIGRLYRTHPGGPCRALTARKSVRPLSSHRLALRSFIIWAFYFGSFFIRTYTIDADSSTPQRFVHRSLARTPRRIKAFRRWSSVPLSTPYLQTTSESSLGSSSERSLDSSSPSSRPSRKRCRSPTASVPSPTHVSRSIAPTPADLLPPRKRFRDSYSPEDSGEEHMEVDTADAEAVADVGISEGVVAHPEDSIDMGVEITASDVREDDEEFEAEASAADMREIAVDPLAIGDSSESSRGGIHDLEDTIYDIVHYMSEVRIDRITKIETTQRQLEASQLVASRERASLVERIRSLRLEYLKEEFRQVRRDRDDTRRRLRRLESTMTITCSGMTLEAIEELINRHVKEALAAHETTRAANALEAENQIQNGSDDDNGNGGNGNPNENSREKYQVKYATCTLLNSALTWWNSHKRTIGTESSFAMSWRELMRLMAEVYCPRNEIQKMESELEDRVEKFLEESLITSKGCNLPLKYKTDKMPVRIANNLMDHKLKGYAMKNAENKRRLEHSPLKGLCTRHYMSDYPKLKDQNHGNKAGNKNEVGEARGKAYVFGWYTMVVCYGPLGIVIRLI